MNVFNKLFGKKQLQNEDEILIDGINANGKPSNEKLPWIKIEGVPTDDGQIRIEADWNDALISHLRKKHGYVGSDEDQIAHKFIAEMHAQIMADMGETNGFE